MKNQETTSSKINISHLMIVAIIAAVIVVIIFGNSDKTDSDKKTSLENALPLTAENIITTWQLEENDETYNYQVLFGYNDEFIYAKYENGKTLPISVSTFGKFTIEGNVISLSYCYEECEYSERYNAVVSADTLILSAVEGGSEFLVGRYKNIENNEFESTDKDLSGSDTSSVQGDISTNEQDVHSPSNSVTSPSSPSTNTGQTVGSETKIPSQVSVSEWKKAYHSFITKSVSTVSSFNLIYVNDDAIPELHISGQSEADGEMICTYHNGQVEVLTLHRLYGVSYIEKSGLIVHSVGHMDYSSDTIYKLEDGKFNILYQGTVEIIEDPTSFYNVYKLNDKEVTQIEYESTLKSSFDYDRARTANGYLSYYQILDELQY